MKYPFYKQILFYLTLAYYNLLSPFECKNRKLQVLLNEFAFLFVTLNLRNLQSNSNKKIILTTKFGKYSIRDIEWDLKVASPAYERLDIDELVNQISRELKNKGNVLFLDIGAQFGKYSVTVGHRLRRFSKNLTIYSFEPNPENYKLLMFNKKLNRLKNMHPIKLALSDKVTKQMFYYYEPQKMVVSFPTSKKIYIHTSTVDHVLQAFKKISDLTVFIKLDVEGHEIEVLKGCKHTVRSAKNVYLLVEDSMTATSKELNGYLFSHGRFITKNTNYNSFWKLTERNT